MIIKLQLPTPATANRSHSVKTVKPLTLQAKIKADRIVLAVIYLLSIIVAVIFA